MGWGGCCWHEGILTATTPSAARPPLLENEEGSVSCSTLPLLATALALRFGLAAAC